MSKTVGKYLQENAMDYENGFILTADTLRLRNLITHYELYKKIIHLQGDVLEFGVFKGSSLIQFCSFREMLENQKARRIIGFDVFGKFPDAQKFDSDKDFIKDWNESFKDEFLTKKDIENSLAIKNFGNAELIEGNILDTLLPFLDKNPQTRCALLHIDVDVYEPTKFILENLFDRVVSGGLVVFDDYGVIEGETNAADEFLAGKGYKLERFTFSQRKPCYLVKK